MKRTSFLPVLFTLAFSSIAYAQNGAGGVNGANRRVTATGGYGGVRATFTEPTSFVIDYPGTNYNLHRSRPDIYTGLKFGHAVEMDAGVAWENVIRPVNGYIYQPSWKCYIRISDQAGLPTTGVEQSLTYTTSDGEVRSWRAERNSLGKFVLNCSVMPDGDVVLTIRQDSPTATSPSINSGPKPVRWPRTAQGKLTNATVRGMVAKRVVAITQQQIHYGVPGDGREINSFGTGVEDAQVSRVWKDANGDLVLNSDWTNWGDVANASVSTFLPPGRYLDSAGRPTGPYIIDLQGINKRGNNGAPTNSGSMWNAETVDILLKRGATTVGGRRARRGRGRRNNGR